MGRRSPVADEGELRLWLTTALDDVLIGNKKGGAPLSSVAPPPDVPICDLTAIGIVRPVIGDGRDHIHMAAEEDLWIRVGRDEVIPSARVEMMRYFTRASRGTPMNSTTSAVLPGGFSLSIRTSDEVR